VIETFVCEEAPTPLGNYSVAVGCGELIFVSGTGPRDPKTNRVPGLVLNEKGERVKYDIEAETRLTLENIQKILVSAGSSLDRVIEVNVYLTNMSDFEAYNRVYGGYFSSHRPARTTIGVASLPGKISIEMKVVASR